MKKRILEAMNHFSPEYLSEMTKRGAIVWWKRETVTGLVEDDKGKPVSRTVENVITGYEPNTFNGFQTDDIIPHDGTLYWVGPKKAIELNEALRKYKQKETGIGMTQLRVGSINGSNRHIHPSVIFESLGVPQV